MRVRSLTRSPAYPYGRQQAEADRRETTGATKAEERGDQKNVANEKRLVNGCRHMLNQKKTIRSKRARNKEQTNEKNNKQKINAPTPQRQYPAHQTQRQCGRKGKPAGRKQGQRRDGAA